MDEPPPSNAAPPPQGVDDPNNLAPTVESEEAASKIGPELTQGEPPTKPPASAGEGMKPTPWNYSVALAGYGLYLLGWGAAGIAWNYHWVSNDEHFHHLGGRQWAPYVTPCLLVSAAVCSAVVVCWSRMRSAVVLPTGFFAGLAAAFVSSLLEEPYVGRQFILSGLCFSICCGLGGWLRRQQGLAAGASFTLLGAALVAVGVLGRNSGWWVWEYDPFNMLLGIPLVFFWPYAMVAGASLLALALTTSEPPPKETS